MKVIHNIEPIYNQKSQILILGSIPSKISRENNFYYANPTNRFWKIIGNIFNVELKDNNDKREFLLKNHIALWDVIKSCDINGSADASIKNVVVNDIDLIIKNSQIKNIYCTGKISHKLFIKYFPQYISITTLLPSPSSANATYSLERLIREYENVKLNI
ncbi:MAG: DNA-deoxyinosine glycosylase [Bacilli bacterium]|nr:DNA-deoxyinosine glycosylase [Bacilli bacterium]